MALYDYSRVYKINADYVTHELSQFRQKTNCYCRCIYFRLWILHGQEGSSHAPNAKTSRYSMSIHIQSPGEHKKEMEGGRLRIPSCQLQLVWTDDTQPVRRLCYQVVMKEAKEPFNFVTIVSEPQPQLGNAPIVTNVHSL